MKQKDINYNDLCKMIASEATGQTTEAMVKRVLKATYKVILNQLKLKNRIYFKGFGYWEIKQRKSGEREINDPKGGGKRIVYVEPRYSIFFKPSVNFDTSVNEGEFSLLTDKITKNLKNKKKSLNSADLVNRANKRIKER